MTLREWLHEYWLDLVVIAAHIAALWLILYLIVAPLAERYL